MNPATKRASPGARRLLVVLACLAGLVGSACSTAERAREIEKEGLQLIQQGRRVEGMKKMQTALDLYPGAYQAALTIAAEKRRKGDAQALEALSILQRLVAEKPDLAIARMALGDLYAALGLDRDALETYKYAAEVATYAPAYLAMASVYQRRLDYSGAEQALRAAIRVQPASADAHYRLAKLYDERGVPEARRVWEAYLSFGAARKDEDASRIAEARERIFALNASLGTTEAKAAFAYLRQELTPAPPGVALGGPVPPSESLPKDLRRPFFGRVFVRVYGPGLQEPIRGAGVGATFAEAIAHAADDIRLARTYDLYVAPQLERTIFVMGIEVGEAEALRFSDDGAGHLTIPGLTLGVDALQLVAAGRKTVVLPSDQANRGLATYQDLIGVATAQVGIGAASYAETTPSRVGVVSFLETAPRADPIALRDGLAAAGNVLPATVWSAARLITGRLRASLNAAADDVNRFGPGYDPLAERALEPKLDLRGQAVIVQALARAAKALGDAEARKVASVGWAAVAAAITPVAEGQAAVLDHGIPSVAATAEAILAAKALETGEVDGLARWLVAATGDESALAPSVAGRVALALAAVGTAEAIDRAADLVANLARSGSLAAAPASAALSVGPGKAKAAFALVELMKLVPEAVARNPYGLNVAEAVVAISALPRSQRTGAIEDLGPTVAGASLALLYDQAGTYPFANQARDLTGLVRRGPRDPRASTEEAARRLVLLLGLAR